MGFQKKTCFRPIWMPRFFSSAIFSQTPTKFHFNQDLNECISWEVKRTKKKIKRNLKGKSQQNFCFVSYLNGVEIIKKMGIKLKIIKVGKFFWKFNKKKQTKSKKMFSSIFVLISWNNFFCYSIFVLPVFIRQSKKKLFYAYSDKLSICKLVSLCAQFSR